MTNRRMKGRPRLLSHVIKAITDLKELRGSMPGRIIDQVRSLLNTTKITPKPRNVVMQVRRALKHGVDSGMLIHRAGKYRMTRIKKKLQPVDSLEIAACLLAGSHRKKRQRSHARQTRSNRRQRRPRRSSRRRKPRKAPSRDVSPEQQPQKKTRKPRNPKNPQNKQDFEENNQNNFAESTSKNIDEDYEEKRPSSKNKNLRPSKAPSSPRKKTPFPVYDDVIPEESDIQRPSHHRRHRRHTHQTRPNSRPPVTDMELRSSKTRTNTSEQTRNNQQQQHQQQQQQQQHQAQQLQQKAQSPDESENSDSSTATLPQSEPRNSYLN